MSTDVTIHDPNADLHSQMEFARMVTITPERGGQSLLPEAYRSNPANVLIAVGLGQAMGLSYAESLYRISVIKGKPSAAAELIAANVRKAGHKLRIKVTEEPPQAVCTIIRADDPDEPVVITRDMKWAQRMGLANEPNYKKQPATMLSYRAITAAARLACPEALYGVSYTPDEAESIEAPSRPETVKKAGTDALRAAVAPEQSAAPVEDITDAEEVHDEPTDPMQGGEDFPAEQNRLNAMFAEFDRAGFTTDARSAEGRKARLDYCSNILGRTVESSKDMSAGEVERVINALKVDGAES